MRLVHRLRATPLTLLAAALLPAASPAQDFHGLSNSISAEYDIRAFREGVAMMANPALEAGRRAVLENDLAPEEIAMHSLHGRGELGFERDPAVSEEVHAALVESIAPAGSQARDSLREALHGGEVWDGFTELLASAGYDSGNFADVMTAWYVISWEVVNDRDAGLTPEGIAAVNDRIVAILCVDPHIAALTPAELQQAAEAMGLLATLAGIARARMEARGQEQELSRLREGLHGAILDTGVDLAGLVLTPDGFVEHR
ncbi:DUF6683 family protein [Oceanicella sp. SM1341]|uniref:DUF6683 family protein n=1 Tax=Oceanicella sp. SM1341 TaxID=1548889 RepID=UPI001300AE90|nr:DUF6683 family protein [Oceanicella sp. SM1341]